MSSLKADKSKNFWVALLAALLAGSSVIFYGIFLICKTWPIDKYTIANAGVFGDSFGVLTSLFSAFAFGGVIYTNIIQSEAYKLQKIELMDSKKELNKTNFENTFFKLLNLLEKNLNQLSYHHASPGKTSQKKGLDALSFFKTGLRQLRPYANIFPESDIQIEKADLINNVSSLISTSQIQLEVYVRTLLNILNFISNSDIENKDLYIQLVKSQLSSQELFALFYISLSPEKETLRDTLISFQMMEYLESDNLLNRNHISMLPLSGAKFSVKG